MPPKFYKKKAQVFTMSKPDSAKYVIIVESPSKCKKIEEYLGQEYYCIATKGHIRHIDNLKSIDIKDTFTTRFSILEEKKEHVEEMRKILNQFPKQNIYLASDADREGEAIAWHICEVFDLSYETTQRIIFHEVTKPAILKAIREPTTINMNLVHSQIARQVLDIIVGYTISPFLWKYLFYDKGNSLSAGRCQTPALSLIYDNQLVKDKKATGCESIYKISGLFTNKKIKFDLDQEFVLPEQVLNFLQQSRTFEHKLTVGQKRESLRTAPQPFHTSRLLQVASNILHISPKETMNLCQQLYQAGHITYMRTESSQYSPIFLEHASNYIIKKYGSTDYLGNLDRIVNNDSANPHEAIRVTHIELQRLVDDSDKRLASMYRLIWKNTVESCMSNAKYNTYALTLTAPAESKYRNVLEIPVFLGWKKVGEVDTEDCLTEQQQGAATLLYLKTLATINYESLESHMTMKNKHHHYTESTLIQTLEELGIGRPSTYASIVETVLERGYVKSTNIEGELVKCTEYKVDSNDHIIKEVVCEKILGAEKNKLVIQPIGILAIEFLKQYFQPIFTYEFSKHMEEKLDMIAHDNNSSSTWSTICKQCYTEMIQLSGALKRLGKQNFVLDENHSFAFEKMGPVIKQTGDDGEIRFLPVKQDLQVNLEKLKKQEYTVDDLIETGTSSLGKYLDEDVFLKYGKYGAYIQWKEISTGIKELTVDKDEAVTLEMVLPFLESKIKSLDPSVEVNNLIRWIRQPDISIRKGKFGPYVYYQTKEMKKPTFFNIKKFKEGIFTCTNETLIQWLNDTYNVKL
uniref:DNA topoisomerase n=1 Tax=viral metagenome TaxID=1070528 RepID=A0A6C0ATH4_9ZZZZ